MNIVFLDCTQNLGYNFSAGNSKVEMLAKGLKAQGNSIHVINGLVGYSMINKTERLETNTIDTIITYPRRRFSKILSFLNLSNIRTDLKNLYNLKEKNILIIEQQYIHIYNLYIHLAHSLGYRVVVISQEWLPTIKRKLWIQNLTSSLYAKTFGKHVDAILPISEFIINKIKHFNKPYLKVPILADYPDETPEEDKINTFLYCVYANYFRVISFIIDSFSLYYNTVDNPYSLTLILTGSPIQIERVKKYIDEKRLTDAIIIKTKLPYPNLIKAFKSARALLIPLNPDFEQDKARFSQKIAEYLSSATPIISNNVGEIEYYFTNNKNIILSDYSIGGFANTFKWVQDNPDIASQIGLEGFNLGKQEFNCIKFGEKLDNFLNTIF